MSGEFEMDTIDKKIIDVLRTESETISPDMADAQKTFEQAKRSGVVSPHGYDVPLMSRLSSKYVAKNHKIAASIK